MFVFECLQKLGKRKLTVPNEVRILTIWSLLTGSHVGAVGKKALSLYLTAQSGIETIKHHDRQTR